MSEWSALWEMDISKKAKEIAVQEAARHAPTVKAKKGGQYPHMQPARFRKGS